MKFLIFILATLVSRTATTQTKQPFTIKGDVRAVTEKIEKVYYTYQLEGKNVNDSSVVRDGRYVLTGMIDDHVMLASTAHYANRALAFDYKRDYSTIHIVPGTNAEVKHEGTFSVVEVKGSTIQDEFMAIRPMLATGDPDFIPGYIRQHPNSPLDIFLLDHYVIGPFMNPAIHEPFYQLLSKENKATPSGRRLYERIEVAKRTVVGKQAPEIQQKDSLGNSVTLSSMKGKYVLLEFWASWCAPCRKENPVLVEAYNKYHDKGFEIFGVSMDTDRKNWLKAVSKDGLSWINLADLQDMDANAAARTYGVVGIPANYLIDPFGKIVARDLRGADLEKKLEQVLKKID